MGALAHRASIGFSTPWTSTRNQCCVPAEKHTDDKADGEALGPVSVAIRVLVHGLHCAKSILGGNECDRRDSGTI